jgi:hypothetical protein
MNTSAIFGQDEASMTLEQKLTAIDQAMQAAQAVADDQAAASGQTAAPVDPATLTICDSCE